MELNIKGFTVLIDDDDWEMVSKFTWSRFGDKRSPYFHAYAGVECKKQRFISLHRLIAKASPNDIVDHISGNTCDNRKCNLRLCTRKENAMNMRLKSNNTSGYKGASWIKKLQKWTAHIKVDGKVIYLGLFDTAELAYSAYCEAAKKYFGEFARLK